MSMLQECRAGAAMPATDLERARKFYEGLGFKGTDNPGGTVYECADGTGFMVFMSGGASNGTHTQLGFEVKGIEAEMEDLRSKGVTFEEYDMPGMKTENGLLRDPNMGTAAWFKDSEGNLISIFEQA
jgi:predicted enzyme related to lactoylglutathione lyase